MYEDFLREHGITKYRLAEISGISYSVIQDLFFGKTSVLNCSYPPLAKAHTPQTMRIRPFAALSSIGVRPVRLNRLPCRTRKYLWLRSLSRKEINFVPCKALE